MQSTSDVQTLEALTEQDGQSQDASRAFGLNESATGKIDPHSVRLRALRVSYIKNGRRRARGCARRTALT
jgi:hypothetical protein